MGWPALVTQLIRARLGGRGERADYDPFPDCLGSSKAKVSEKFVAMLLIK